MTDCMLSHRVMVYPITDLDCDFHNTLLCSPQPATSFSKAFTSLLIV